jgi:hypothetical protein
MREPNLDSLWKTMFLAPSKGISFKPRSNSKLNFLKGSTKAEVFGELEDGGK